MNFKTLHQQEEPLLLCNVWDVASAKTAEKSGFHAIGTSSSAIASSLGYRDGEEMSFAELEYLVKRIAVNTNLPLSVDLESGYSRSPINIAKHIKRLVDLGVVGINLEDSVVTTHRTILDAEQFARIISAVNKQLKKDGTKVFINVRTDSFILGHPNPVAETQKRIRYYEKAGADGIFVPCILQEADIKAIAAHTNLPVNVMCMPDLPNFEKLKDLGVKRISMGNFLFDRIHLLLEQHLRSIKNQNSFKSIFFL